MDTTSISSEEQLQLTNCRRQTDSTSPTSSQCSSAPIIESHFSATKSVVVQEPEPEATTCDNDDQDEEEQDAEDDEQPRKATDHCNQRQQQHQHQHHQQHWQHRHKEFQRDLDDVKQVELFGVSIVALTINGKDRLCLAQISNTLLKEFSYNEIHNRRVALGITCIQCTPIQLEMLRRAGAMPSSSRRCGMITMREAERLCRSFLVEEQPPELPDNFYFTVAHRVNYGCKGRFVPARYISSRAKCIECFYCGEFYSPNKFIFHSHRQPNNTDCNPPDSPNINSWRKHIDLDWTHDQSQEIRYAWEDVKSLFNGGTRRRAQPSMGGAATSSGAGIPSSASSSSAAAAKPPTNNSVRIKSSHQLSASDRQMGRFGGALPTSGDEEQDHIDVVCDEQRPSQINEQQSRSAAAGRHNNNDLVRTPRVLSVHHQRITGGGSAAKRSHNGLDGPMQPLSKRSSAPSHPLYRHQNQSILDEPQSASDKQTNAHRAGSLGPFALPGSQMGHQFNGIDCSSSRRSVVGGASGNRLDKPINLGTSQYNHNASNTNPLLIAPDANFIHSQLYSQLMQPHQQQIQAAHPQLGLTPDSMDTQAAVALRHHLWTSLLANLQCNFATNNHQIYSMAQQQQQQPVSAAASRLQQQDLSVATPSRSSIEHLLASYPQVGTAKLISSTQTELNLNNYTASQ